MLKVEEVKVKKNVVKLLVSSDNKFYLITISKVIFNNIILENELIKNLLNELMVVK